MRSCSDDSVAAFDASGIKVRSLRDGSEKEVYRFTGNPGTVLPLLSHDGGSIEFIMPEKGGSVLRVIPAAGGPARDLAAANSPAELQPLWGLAWSPDDRFVYFARRPDGHAPFELFRVPVTGGSVESAGLKSEDVRDLDIAPDGTRIAFSIGAVNQPEIWSVQNFLPRGK